MKKLPILLLIIPLMILSCGEKKDKNSQDKQQNTLSAPAFDSDSAFAFVKAQTDFGPRVPNSDAHANCANYLRAKLQEFCDTVYVQQFTTKAYNGTVLHCQNLIGSFYPDKSERILLASHWDSRPMADHDAIEANRDKAIDGADDGASGVGVLLELARQLQQDRPQLGVDIIFFDAEDYGTPSGVNLPGDWWCLGSQYWSNNQHVENYNARYGILLDMVGAPDAKFYHEYFSSFFAQDIVSKVWGMAYRLGYGNYFINQQANPITDDHYYVNKLAHIKMIDIIHQDGANGTGFRSVWHTTNDNIENIDAKTLGVVGSTLRAVLKEEHE